MSARGGLLIATVMAGLAALIPLADSSAAGTPGRITFLAATCPASSSMYTRVVAGQDPSSGENGTPAAPTDVAAYGCSQSAGLNFFLLANSTTGSLFLDEALTQPVAVSTTETGATGGATLVSAGATAYVPGDTAQTRRLSVSNYPSTITTRAAMPFLDLQCGSDGINGDNADGIGWNNQALAAGSQHYCIAYVWDGVAASTPTTAATSTPTPTATPTTVATNTPTPIPSPAASPAANPTMTVNFPGLSDVHVYAHAADGVSGAAGGSQAASATWKSGSATLTVGAGTYDVRVVHGPVTIVVDGVNCSANCSVDVPLATLTVNFPGLSDIHSYAHGSDGAVGTYGAQDSSSTWKANSTSMTLLRGTYDVRVVHGPMQTVFDAIDCTGATCSVTVPTAVLTVNFPGMSDVHSYAHKSDGAPDTYGAQDSSSTWKASSTTITLMQGMYDVRVVHGPMTYVFDDIDCRGATCSASVPMAQLTVNFPGMSDIHTYAHRTDGTPGTYGAQDSSQTWKANSTTLTLIQGIYDVRIVHGPVTLVLDNIDCRAATCSADVPIATLSVTFPGLTDAHTYAHASDGSTGTYGAQDSSSTWKANGTTLTLLQAVYDVRVVHGPMTSVLDSIDCRQATCSADVPLAKLTVSFPGHSNVHTYVKQDDAVYAAANGTVDSSSTWKSNGTEFTLLRGIYDVVIREGSTDTIVDAVDCRASACSAALNDGVKPGAKVIVQKTFVREEDGSVVWKLAPTAARTIQVWDAAATRCEAFDGADCGGIGSSGAASFSASGSAGQYLFVYQPFTKDGEACNVSNTAEWLEAAGTKETVTASYVCSGAPTMGWALFALFATGAAGVAWVVQRKYPWPR